MLMLSDTLLVRPIAVKFSEDRLYNAEVCNIIMCLIDRPTNDDSQRRRQGGSTGVRTPPLFVDEIMRFVQIR
jgi:hypothetical protein